jgi:hypothetical protein
MTFTAEAGGGRHDASQQFWFFAEFLMHRACRGKRRKAARDNAFNKNQADTKR